MGVRTFGLAGASLAALMVLPDVARAEEPITIAWEAPSSCPASESVRSDVDRLLGGGRQKDREPLTVVGKIDGQGKSFRLSLSIKGSGKEAKRKLDASSCETLSEAGALLIALAFDPEAVAAAAAAPATATATPTATPTTTTTATATATPTPTATPTTTARSLHPRSTASSSPASRRDVRSSGSPSAERRLPGWGIGAGFLGDAGSLPAVAPGLRVTAVVILRAYELQVAFEAWPSSEARLAGRDTGGAEFSLFAGVLRGCRMVLPWRPIESPVSLLGCLDIEAGRMGGAGFGVTRPSNGGAFWIAPGTSLDLRLDVSHPLGFVASGGFVVPLDRRSFVIQTPDRDVVHEPSPVSARFGLAADVRF